MIGDCHTAALVGLNGSIDWLCIPRFDSPACFAALLGNADNGRWQIAPSEPIRKLTRRYRPGALILETEIETDEGAVTLIDFMPPRPRQAPDLVRLVIGRRGRVRMHTELVIRFDYGSVPWVRHTDTGLQAIAGPDSLYLDTTVKLHGENLKTVGDFEVAAGEEKHFVLMWHPSHEQRASSIDCADCLASTDEWWQCWSRHFKYEGPWKDLVLRSLITLKALTYARPAESSPRRRPRCPSRSAARVTGTIAFVGSAMRRSRSTHSCLAALLTKRPRGASQLLRAVAGSPSQVNIMYGIRGERRLTEMELPWLGGYENSSPVRIGNAAWSQFQLDVFGEVPTRCMRPGGWDSETITTCGRFSSNWPSTSNSIRASRTKAFGRSAVRGGTSSTRRSWPGSPSTG